MRNHLHSEQTKKLPENMYCINYMSTYQYAAGICGISRFNEVYVKSETEGFKTKKEALEFCKKHNLHTKYIKGRGDIGYGDVGSENNIAEIIKIKDYNNRQEKDFRYGYFRQNQFIAFVEPE